MLKMIAFELYKIFQKRMLWLLAGICFLSHLAVLAYQMERPSDMPYSVKEFSAFYETLIQEGKSPSELQSEIEEYEQAVQDAAVPDISRIKYHAMAQKVVEREAEIGAYEEYRTYISEQADKRLASSFFSDMDAYTRDSLRMTKEAYETLGPVELANDFDGGLLLLWEDVLMDVMLLALGALFVLRLFVEEREDGTWFLIKSMREGHGGLILSKLCALTLLLIGMTTLFYGSSYLLIGRRVGFGDISRSIQSVEGFSACNLSVTVSQYFIWNFIMKAVSILALCIVFVVVCMIFRNTIISTLAFALILAAECMMWIRIPTNSWLSFIKEINLAAYFQANHYFRDFYYINFFSFPVSHRACGLVLSAVFLFGGAALAFFLHECGMFVALPELPVFLTKRRVRKRLRIKNAMVFEGYKQLALNKGWVILAAIFLLSFGGAFTTRHFIDGDEYYYRMYADRMRGELCGENEAYLIGEERFYDEIGLVRQQMQEAHERGEFDRQELRRRLEELDDQEQNTARREALKQVRRQYDALKGMAANGREVTFVYETPWQILIGNAARRTDVMKLAVCFLAMILVEASAGALEKKNDMYGLLSLTVIGKGGIRARKAAVFGLAAVLIISAVFLPDVCQVAVKYGLQDAGASVAGCGDCPAFWGTLPLGACLFLKYLFLCMIAVVASVVLLWISEKVCNRTVTILSGCVVFLVPLAMVMLNLM